MVEPISLALQRNAAALAVTQEKPADVPFGRWGPDLPEFGNQAGLLEASGVIPAKDAYRPANSLVPVSTNALDNQAIGVGTGRDKDNNIFLYAGDKTKLYDLRGNAFTDISNASGYNTSDDDVWEFALWDINQQIFATNFANPVQEITVGAAAGTKFADLITGTNKPSAKHMAVVRNFLVLGNTNDITDGHRPNRIWWSAIRNPTNFDPDATTQSDYEDLDQGGWVQRIVGGSEYGVVFQESQIRRLEYVGPAPIFDPAPVDRQRGTPIPNSVVGYGRFIFYIAEDGFFVFNGSSSEPIGNDIVDRAFWRQFDIANKRQVSAAIDRTNKLVCWAFPSTSSVGGLPNKIFCYKWDESPPKWSEIPIEVEMIFDARNQGFTLEQLDTVNNNIDLLQPTLDSDVWKGGKIYSGAFDTQHVLSSFDGPHLRAVLDTRDVQLTKGRTSYVNSVRPIITLDPAQPPSQTGLDISIATFARDRLDVTPTQGILTGLNDIGEADADVEGRYHRFRTVIEAGQPWEFAQGLEVYKSDGTRI